VAWAAGSHYNWWRHIWPKTSNLGCGSDNTTCQCWGPSSKYVGYRCQGCYGACHSQRRRPRNSNSHSGYYGQGRYWVEQSAVTLFCLQLLRLRYAGGMTKVTRRHLFSIALEHASASGLDEELSTWGRQTQRHQDAETRNYADQENRVRKMEAIQCMKYIQHINAVTRNCAGKSVLMVGKMDPGDDRVVVVVWMTIICNKHVAHSVNVNGIG